MVLKCRGICCVTDNVPIVVDAQGVRGTIIRGKEALEVHDAVGGAIPHQRVVRASACTNESKSDLLAA